MTKMTKREKFEMLSKLSEVQSNEVLRDFIAHEMELLEKKNSAPKKPTSAQIANEAIKTAIVDGMEANRYYSVTEIIKEIPECAELSNQRVSALLRQMKDDGIVTRTEDKRKAYFSIVG